MGRRKFILIEDNLIFRESLETFLSNQYNAEIIGLASNAEEAHSLTTISKADFILMDVFIPGTNGINLTKELLWEYSCDLKIIAITMHTEKVYLRSLIEAGFKGCVLKSELAVQLKEALETVSSGRLYFPRSIKLDYEEVY